MSHIADFSIESHRFLDAEGKPEADLPPIADDSETLIALYQNMVYTRIYDDRSIALQRTGRMGTFASSLGQEAIGAGVGHAMLTDDVLVPSFREGGAFLFRGFRVRDMLLYWGGDEQGMSSPDIGEDYPICVPIATHACHAVGTAFAFKYRKQPRATLCLIGDGGTSKGDFYEAINLAGAWHLPVVFVINNNQWAISVPRGAQTNAQTLAQKAIAAGIPGIQIDGNDAIAVRHFVGEALDKARHGGGATLIEAMSYRMCHHTTADDATRYRPDEELEAYRAKDPIKRLRNFMTSRGIWSQEQEEALIKTSTEDIEQEVAAYLDTPAQPPQSMLDHLYAKLPKELRGQWQELAGEAPDHD